MTCTADRERVLASVRHLYDAAIDANRWPIFLKCLAEAFQAKGSQIVRVQPRDQTLSFSALYGYDDDILRKYGDNGSTNLPEAIARYERHFTELMPTDPRVRFLKRYPGRPLSCRLEISETALHTSKVYQDMLRFADVEYSLLVSLAEDDGSLIMLGVFRSKQSRHFDQQEVEVFSELIPHVKQAINLSEHLARASFTTNAAIDALDTLAMGVVITDRSARIVHANAAGQRIIGLADGMAAQNGCLRLHHREEDVTLRTAIRKVLADTYKDITPPSEAMSITRPSGREPLPLLIGALSRNKSRQRLGPLDRPLAILFVSLPEEPQEAPAELLRRLFGFTLAEARICERLVQGRTVDDIASDFEIAVDTVRAHLKKIFAKAGVSRQTELVAKIMATPVWIHHQNRRIGKSE